MKSFVVPVLLLVVVAAVVEAQSTSWTSPGVNCVFKAKDGASTEVSTCLRGYADTYKQCFVKNHPYLSTQHLNERPTVMLFQKLHGTGVEWTNLAIRSDNLYIVGFANGAGTWYSFKPDRPGKYVIPGSIVLSFGDSYQELVGLGFYGAWTNLIFQDLSRMSIVEAITVLYTYDPQTTSDARLKGALVKLALFVCESTRFPYIQQLIHQAFDQDDGSLMDYQGALLAVNWQRISCAILISIKKGCWNSIEAIELGKLRPAGLGIGHHQHPGGAEVYPILQGKRCSDEYQPVCKKQQ